MNRLLNKYQFEKPHTRPPLPINIFNLVYQNSQIILITDYISSALICCHFIFFNVSKLIVSTRPTHRCQSQIVSTRPTRCQSLIVSTRPTQVSKPDSLYPAHPEVRKPNSLYPAHQVSKPDSLCPAHPDNICQN